MYEQAIVDTADYVKRQMSGEATGHDWWHVHRVWKMSLRIGREEGGDLDVIQLAALLHDIADWKFHGGDTEIGPYRARIWLRQCRVDESVIDQVCAIIATMSFRGAGVADIHCSREAEIVQDADRLDAIGAVGIARTFAYGGARGREMFDPDVAPEFHDSPESYRMNGSPTINHFYEKLLLLKDRMNTQSGRRIAKERHEYMQEFLRRFRDEWNGDA